jgi:UDP-N-acetylglucosamine/UDP-N-acetylgalactosamine diphosphorylase
MELTNGIKILVDRYEQSGQGHVFRFFEALDVVEQRSLVEQAASIDLEELDGLVNLHLHGAGEEKVDFGQLEPPPCVGLPGGADDVDGIARWKAAIKAGEKALRAGKVAAFTVAGGQGTRLGFDGPKGTFPSSPVQQKSLFAIFADKIARSAERYNSRIPWFIMTSGINHTETVGFFESNNFFGLDPACVHFFSQGLMPAVDLNGKIILSDRGTIAMSPDGHGGALRALVRSGAVDHMQREGIEHLAYFQVDNPLVRCIDPAFIGFHVEAGSELSSKMTPKAYAGEKVGHFCRYGDSLRVIEYSDLPVELAELKDGEGNLKFRAGSIAIHVFDREFIRRVGDASSDSRLPFHRADKKIPCIDFAGNPVKPAAPNGVKFEMFVFDALPMAKDPVIIETAREDDFSPIKNADGTDSPATCRDDLLRLYARWLKAAGETIETDASGLPSFSFEIDFRFACDEADFVKRWQALDTRPKLGEGLVIR